MHNAISALIELSRELGREDRRLCILGEGNTSARLGKNEFAVKASGTSLSVLTEKDLVACHLSNVLSLLDERLPTDEGIDSALLGARLDPASKKPSIEAVFHAWLLTLEDVKFVGHCHSLSANQVLCSPRARDFAEQRLFPDQVIYCGATSVYVPYTDPGLPLAREIRNLTLAFIQQKSFVPRLIVLQNHGLIALGQTPKEVLACLLMADKAAAIFTGAASMGGPNFLRAQQVQRIATRPDETYRQQQLKL